MNGIYFDGLTSPNSDEEIELIIRNVFTDEYRKIDKDIYFSEMFVYLEDVLKQNVNCSLTESFEKENIYNFASASVDKKKSLLDSISGMSFSVEYEDGVIIELVSFKEYFKGLLRKVCENVELMQVVEYDVSYNGSLTYKYVFSDKINNPDSYIEFLNMPDKVKESRFEVDGLKSVRLVKESKRAIIQYNRNLKNAMTQEYNRRIREEIKDVDLKSFVKSIYENAA